MLNLPQTTEFNKRLPKKKFYEQLEVAPEIKRIFVDQIKNIIWKNKIAPSTTNIASGENVTEIEVFEVQLNEKHLDENILKTIDQGIPYHIIFVLHYEKQIQVWVAFKEVKNKENTKSRVQMYYHTDWMEEDSYKLELVGINMDQVYENLVRALAKNKLANRENESLKESIARAHEVEQLEKKVKLLQAKFRKEKQFNKKVKINNEIKSLKIKLQELLDGKNEIRNARSKKTEY